MNVLDNLLIAQAVTMIKSFMTRHVLILVQKHTLINLISVKNVFKIVFFVMITYHVMNV